MPPRRPKRARSAPVQERLVGKTWTLMQGASSLARTSLTAITLGLAVLHVVAARADEPDLVARVLNGFPKIPEDLSQRGCEKRADFLADDRTVIVCKGGPHVVYAQGNDGRTRASTRTGPLPVGTVKEPPGADNAAGEEMDEQGRSTQVSAWVNHGWRQR